ncbi:hypothetical protein GUJ93_ZPchr0001g30936, partial [Zizania palustris]
MCPNSRRPRVAATPQARRAALHGRSHVAARLEARRFAAGDSIDEATSTSRRAAWRREPSPTTSSHRSSALALGSQFTIDG